LIKGQHKLLAVAVDIVCAVSPNDDDAAGDGDDDADHFAACLHPLLSALVMMTSKV
jgi:hypothetical protein